MPRGKELEQLPMSNMAPGVGDDPGRFNRRGVEGMMDESIRPRPGEAGQQNKGNKK